MTFRLIRSVLLLASLTLAPLPAAPTTVVRGPYLQLATPTSIVVRWRTDTAEPSVVSYGTARNALRSNAKAEGLATEHIVALLDLKPGTKYFYAMGATSAVQPAGDGQTAVDATPGRNPLNSFTDWSEVDGWATLGESVLSPISSFTTPPLAGPPQPTRIWVLGDPGTKGRAQRAVRDAYYKFAGDRPADLWLLLGDNAYPNGTDDDYQKAIFEMYPKTLRTSPVWSTLGNHDGYSANSVTQSGVYYDVFTLPTRAQAGGVVSGTEAYYSFDYANIHFVCLDSHDSDRSAGGAMMQWLKADLPSTSRDWIIAFFHHPIYTKGTHDSDRDKDSDGRMNDMRGTFLPVLEAGGVDLVLTGHSHVYERSYLLNGHYGKSETFDAQLHVKQKGDGRAAGDGVYRKPRARTAHTGEISVVTGSAGYERAGTAKLKLNHPAMVVSLNEAGSVVLDIDALRLQHVFINEKGEKRDWFTLVKE